MWETVSRGLLLLLTLTTTLQLQQYYLHVISVEAKIQGNQAPNHAAAELLGHKKRNDDSNSRTEVSLITPPSG